MKRLFVGIELPTRVLDSIETAVSSFVKKIPIEARITKRENVHITISFLGEQDEKIIPGILEAMKGVTIPETLFIETHSIDYGPPSFEKRMVWLNLKKETSNQLELVKLSLEANLYRNGISWERENFPRFNGHVTLARFNPRTRDRLESIFSFFESSFHPEKLVLFESVLTPFGPEYTKIDNRG